MSNKGILWKMLLASNAYKYLIRANLFFKGFLKQIGYTIKVIWTTDIFKATWGITFSWASIPAPS